MRIRLHGSYHHDIVYCHYYGNRNSISTRQLGDEYIHHEFRLRPCVVRWLKKNCVGRWKFSFHIRSFYLSKSRTVYLKPSSRRRHYTFMYLQFNRESDYVLFKLKFGFEAAYAN